MSKVTVTDASKLDTRRKYVILSATTLTGPAPTLVGASDDEWKVRVSNGNLALVPNKGLVFVIE